MRGTGTLTKDDHSLAGRGANVGPFLTLIFDRARPVVSPRRFCLERLARVEVGRGRVDGHEITTHDGARLLRIDIADPKLSERHFELAPRPGGWTLRDLGSKNGTLVDGASAAGAVELADDTLVEAARCTFLFRRRCRGVPGGPPVIDVAALAARPDGMATFHPGLERTLAIVEQVAASTLSVLVHGETGTGKELVAQALHELSGRGGPFVAVNCGALPDELVESELFGHRRGAFSGATEDRPGLVRAAHKGTLFLDEIGDLPATSQASLLRVLQERAVTPVGDTRPISVDVRVVAATHRDLAAEQAEGRFRLDLLGRLTGFVVELPPLRERREDVGLLIARMVRRGRFAWPDGTTLSRRASLALLGNDWPLNVRGLENAVAAALVVARGGELGREHLQLPAAARRRDTAVPLDDGRRAELVALLEQHKGNISAIARALATSRSQVERLLERHGLDAASFR